MNRVWIWVRRSACLVLVLLAAVLAITSVLPILTTDAWWVRYAVFPALEIAIAMIGVGALLLLLRHWTAWVALGALGVGLVVQSTRLAPYVAPLALAWPDPVVPAGSCAPQNRLRVLEVNVQRTNRHDHTLLEMVRKLDPDIAWFQEVNGWWENELSSLSPILPYAVKDVQANYFGVHLFSKLPLSDTSVQELTQSNNPSIFATATLASGRAVRLYAVHPRPPQIGQSTAERDAQLMATALAAHDDTLPHVMLGDLNTVPWDAILDQVEPVGRVADPRVGRGLFITWNAKRTLAKWPLDHILPGPGISLENLRVMPPFGSDHQPLLAKLCIGAPAAPPAPLDPARLAAARATVAFGQGKALGPSATAPAGATMNEKED